MKNEIIENRAYTLRKMAEITGYNFYTLKGKFYSGKIKTISEAGDKIMILGSEIKRFMKIK
ncbi:hypothetical protein A2215_02090 [Candidatus Berkelbacteria bacterium RIFOXYA2_FULL_43_10]|uniref:Uncharacterized protein n=1 Tax=Candidatus Berkelbacteria bacterium RIFOXYA2_FULL_43_10 TaxID=1797472 RepID=A0A1F5E657_9BACT|nr:MAG: hypothetical protein A2215_02090 [Candidatus Berkelbacteria bacterium RIFOXYA2_FULL_43_10]